jgi:hypothetical protein
MSKPKDLPKVESHTNLSGLDPKLVDPSDHPAEMRAAEELAYVDGFLSSKFGNDRVSMSRGSGGRVSMWIAHTDEEMLQEIVQILKVGRVEALAPRKFFLILTGRELLVVLGLLDKEIHECVTEAA